MWKLAMILVSRYHYLNLSYNLEGQCLILKILLLQKCFFWLLWSSRQQTLLFHNRRFAKNISQILPKKIFSANTIFCCIFFWICADIIDIQGFLRRYNLIVRNNSFTTVVCKIVHTSFTSLCWCGHCDMSVR